MRILVLKTRFSWHRVSRKFECLFFQTRTRNYTGNLPKTMMKLKDFGLLYQNFRWATSQEGVEVVSLALCWYCSYLKFVKSLSSLESWSHASFWSSMPGGIFQLKIALAPNRSFTLGLWHCTVTPGSNSNSNPLLYITFQLTVENYSEWTHKHKSIQAIRIGVGVGS